MGIPVLILGKSGSGKSTALRNFSPDEIGILNVASKPLPFRAGNHMKVINHASYDTIFRCLARASMKAYAIDDSQYLMAFEEFDHVKETGYTKFTNMALNFYTLIKAVIENTPEDCIVYFLHHVETLDSGEVKAKTVGKMIDSKLTLEGLFSIVLMAQTDGKKHVFVTQSDGFTPAKAPMEMFPQLEIPNDLKAVDTAIREYYGLNGQEGDPQ